MCLCRSYKLGRINGPKIDPCDTPLHVITIEGDNILLANVGESFVEIGFDKINLSP